MSRNTWQKKTNSQIINNLSDILVWYCLVFYSLFTLRHNSYTYSARIHTKTSYGIYLYLILIEFEVFTVINGPSTLLRFIALVRSAQEEGGVINLGPFFTVRTSNTTDQRWCPSPPPPSVRLPPLALPRDNGFFLWMPFQATNFLGDLLVAVPVIPHLLRISGQRLSGYHNHCW